MLDSINFSQDNIIENINITVLNNDEGKRIDKFICEKIDDTTRSFIQKLIKNGYLLVNNKKVGSNYKIKVNDNILINIPKPKSIIAKPEAILLDIIYEDKDLLIVNKSKGMVVHPAAGNYEGTLVNALLYHCGDSLSGINGELRPGIVHRIDKDTSGLLIVAKNDFAHRNLAEQIKLHSFNREYEAIVYGRFKVEEGTISLPIGRHPIDRKRMAVSQKNSKHAVTHYRVIKQYDGFTHLRLKLDTGRTHQIRVHMSYIGHPIAGDAVYGPKNVIKNLNGQCLHAKLLGFIHPRTNKYMEFESDLPEYFKKFVNKLEKNIIH